jgi:hypothetical protein
MVNSVIDYPYKVETGRIIILCKKLPGNKLEFMGPAGWALKLSENEFLHGRIRVEDQNRNFAEVRFVLKNDPKFKDFATKHKGIKVNYGENKKISATDYHIQFKKRSLYEDCWVEHSYSPSFATNHWSGIVNLQPAGLAIHEAVEIQIKPAKDVTGLENKLLMVGIDTNGKEETLGGKFTGGWVNATSRMLGKFVLKVDTIAPVASTPKWKTDGLTKMQMVVIPVNDNLAGIKTYRVLLGDSWVLGEYNSRYKEITIYPKFLPSMITILNLTVELEDRVGNKSIYQFSLNR